MAESFLDDLRKCGRLREYLFPEFYVAFAVTVPAMLLMMIQGVSPTIFAVTTVVSPILLVLTGVLYMMFLNLGPEDFRAVLHRHVLFLKLRTFLSLTSIILAVNTVVGTVMCVASSFEPIGCQMGFAILAIHLQTWAICNVTMFIVHHLRILGGMTDGVA